MKKTIAVVLLTVLAFGALAFAQQKVDQGRPGTQGCWPVCMSGGIALSLDGGFLGSVSLVSDGGFIGTVGPVRCTTITNSNTSVGVAATTVPAAPQAGRIYITVCNSSQNAGVDNVKCRADGVAPVFAAGNAGDYLEEGDCIQYAVNASQTIQCIANAAATNVLAFECTP